MLPVQRTGLRLHEVVCARRSSRSDALSKVCERTVESVWPYDAIHNQGT